MKNNNNTNMFIENVWVLSFLLQKKKKNKNTEWREDYSSFNQS